MRHLWDGGMNGGYSYNRDGTKNFHGLKVSSGASPTPGIKGGYTVYQGIKNGKVVYWGLTKNLTKRRLQHGDRFDQVFGIYENISRSTARGLEQFMIDKYGIKNLQNLINGVGIKNPRMMEYYQSAIRYLQTTGL